MPDTNLQVQADKKSQSDLKIILLEDEMIMIKSQLLQLGLMTRELRDKVELVDIKQVSNINVTETLKQSSENRSKEKYKVKPKGTKTQMYNCNQCNCTFKKDITLQKHKNTRHGQPHKVDIVTVSISLWGCGIPLSIAFFESFAASLMVSAFVLIKMVRYLYL